MSKIVFINQSGGRLFQEFIAAAAETWGKVSYYTADQAAFSVGVRLVKMPRYINRSPAARLSSWLSYLLRAGYSVLTERGKPLLFIVTNPPLSPILGVIAKKLRRQRYILLFFDVYPDALVRFAGIAEQSIITRTWRYFNRLSITHAERVITISAQVAETLEQYYSLKGVLEPRVEIVPTWVDTDRIQPLPKEQNWFARQQGQIGKLTILYSGNLGAVHDTTMLPRIADRLREFSDIHLMVIGEGVGRKSLVSECTRLGLPNVTLLPLQDEATLPFSLATGDIGIVALARGAEGISMPSKTYYAMAAGNALLGFSSSGSDLAAVIHRYQCGINIVPGDVDSAVGAILLMRDQPALLQKYRENARRAAEQHFSRAVCVPRMLALIRELL